MKIHNTLVLQLTSYTVSMRKLHSIIKNIFKDILKKYQSTLMYIKPQIILNAKIRLNNKDFFFLLVKSVTLSANIFTSPTTIYIFFQHVFKKTLIIMF